MTSIYPEPHHDHEKHVGKERRPGKRLAGKPHYEAPEHGRPPQKPQPTPTARRKSTLKAGLLSIFLGWVGAGRFYLGSPWIGVAQIAASILTAGVAGIIWGIVEGIIILSRAGNLMTTDAAGIPLK